MAVGTPERIIDEIVRQGKRELTVIANDTALPLLLRARQQMPRHVDLLYALGECLSRLGRPSRPKAPPNRLPRAAKVPVNCPGAIP